MSTVSLELKLQSTTSIFESKLSNISLPVWTYIEVNCSTKTSKALKEAALKQTLKLIMHW